MDRKHLIVPDTLTVRGHSLSPQSSRPVSSDSSGLPVRTLSNVSTSDDVSERSQEYTVLDGVRDMNQMLVRQIDVIRKQIALNERIYNEEKAKLLESNDSELQKKGQEIDELKESLNHRDESIHQLKKAGAEKEKVMRDKSLEIDDLRKMIEQIKDKARKIQNQVRRAHKERKNFNKEAKQGKPEDDALYKQKIEEMGILTEEMLQLRDRLTTMEEELAKALKVIQQQDQQLKNLDADNLALQAKFKEDLNNVSKSLTQEVERTREVMRQNYEEMKVLRQQNQDMHEDIRVIKSYIEDFGTGAKNSQKEHCQVVDDSQQSETINQQTNSPTETGKTGRPHLQPAKLGKLSVIRNKMPPPQVKRQNYEEMKVLRQQNQDLHEDIRVIKSYLKDFGTGAKNSQKEHCQVVDESQQSQAINQQTNSPTETGKTGRPQLQSAKLEKLPVIRNKMPPPQVRLSSPVFIKSVCDPRVIFNNGMHKRRNAVLPKYTTRTDSKYMSVQTLHMPDVQKHVSKRTVIPPIPSAKEGFPHPSLRGGSKPSIKEWFQAFLRKKNSFKN